MSRPRFIEHFEHPEQFQMFLVTVSVDVQMNYDTDLKHDDNYK